MTNEEDGEGTPSDAADSHERIAASAARATESIRRQAESLGDFASSIIRSSSSDAAKRVAAQLDTSFAVKPLVPPPSPVLDSIRHDREALELLEPLPDPTYDVLDQARVTNQRLEEANDALREMVLVAREDAKSTARKAWWTLVATWVGVGIMFATMLVTIWVPFLGD